MTEEARIELLTRLKTARRTRLGRRGHLGPVVEALHRTADLMDAEDRKREQWQWQQYVTGRRPVRPRPPCGWPEDPAQLMTWGPGFLAAYGLDSLNQFDEVRHSYRAPGGAGHEAWKAWLHERRAICAEMKKLLLPSWRDSPSLTPTRVRAIADRLAADVQP